MSKKILLVGGGGHCKSVIDALFETNNYSDIGIIEKDKSAGKEILGVPIIGCDDDLPRLYQEGFTHAFVTVGSLGKPKLRIKLLTILEEIGFEIPNIVDPTAVVSRHSRLDKGVFIGKNSVVNAGSAIYKGAIINTSVLVEHDCIVEEFAHIAPGTVLCGDVHIGAGTHVGARSVIKQQIKVGSNTLIGMGSVVLCDIGSNIIAYGHPCKEHSCN